MWQKSFLRALLSLGVLAALVGVLAPTYAMAQVDKKHFYTSTDVQSFVKKWQGRDGAGASMISDAFCSFVMIDPDIFLAVMLENMTTFNAWLEEMPNLSFVDVTECTRSESRRESMIAALEERTLHGQSYEKLRVMLIERLKAIKVRKIE